jgi:hypothetical protein
MTVAYRADPDRGFIITVWEGAVTTALLRADLPQRP